jgi:UDP-galactopyranose mutase
MEYDYLIVGAGLFGAVFAYEAANQNKTCLVIDKRDHIGGNLYTENIDEIIVHKYGAHIFHTNEKKVWNYINQFGDFNNFINSPIANYKGETYNLPFNMNTFCQLWGEITPAEVKQKINQEIAGLNISKITNLEEQAITMVGTTLYNKLIKGYTEKQWGYKCAELPPSIIKRLPLRFTYNNNYFNDSFQGVPIVGYTPIINKMLKKADIRLGVEFKDFIKTNPTIANKIMNAITAINSFDDIDISNTILNFSSIVVCVITFTPMKSFLFFYNTL